MSLSAMDTDQISISVKGPGTVKDELDARIERLRNQLEETMVLRAKAEFLGCLDYPMEFIHAVCF